MTSRLELQENSILLTTAQLPSLNGLRGISILIVIAGHAFSDPIPWLPGRFGVSIFFVISGFLITTLLLKEYVKTRTVSLKHFYIRRFFRIIPLAYLYLFVLLFINIIFSLHIYYGSFISSAFFFRNTSLLHEPVWWTGHYWSLSVEEQYYILYPFLLLLCVKNIRLFIFILVLFIILIPVANYGHSNGWFDSFYLQLICELLRNLSGLLVGSLLSVLLFTGVIHANFVPKFRTVISLVCITLAIFFYNKPISFLPTTMADFFIAALILINIIPGDSYSYRLLNNPFLATIGILSYSIYIWQQLFTANFPWGNSFWGANSLWLNLPLLAVVSYVSYYWYEKKFLIIKDRFR